jgi:acyl dehydratase
MKTSPALLRYQGPMLAALGRTALGILKGVDTTAKLETPGPMFSEIVEPRADELIDAYLDWCGTNRASYKDTLPPHLYPQWGFPLLSKTLANLPYKLTSVLNQGTRVEVRGPIPRGVPLRLRARLEAVEDDGFKVRIHQKLWTGIEGEEDDRLITDVYATIVYKKRDGGAAKKAEESPATVDAGTWSVDKWDGFRFGILTGDLNPVHWIPPYAKVAGFKRQILHGFASFARTWEVLAKDGEIKEADVRFVKPLILPAKVRVLKSKADKKGVMQVRLVGDKDQLYMAGQFQK